MGTGSCILLNWGEKKTCCATFWFTVLYENCCSPRESFTLRANFEHNTNCGLPATPSFVNSPGKKDPIWISAKKMKHPLKVHLFSVVVDEP